MSFPIDTTNDTTHDNSSMAYTEDPRATSPIEFVCAISDTATLKRRFKRICGYRAGGFADRAVVNADANSSGYCQSSPVPTSALSSSLSVSSRRDLPVHLAMHPALGRSFFSKKTPTHAAVTCSSTSTSTSSGHGQGEKVASLEIFHEKKEEGQKVQGRRQRQRDRELERRRVTSAFDTAGAARVATSDATFLYQGVEKDKDKDKDKEKEKERVGPFSFDAPQTFVLPDPRRLNGTLHAFVGVSACEIQVLKELVASGWCTEENLERDVVDVLDDSKRGIPLRQIDFALTNTAKKRPMLYDVLRPDGTIASIDPYVSYKKMVQSYNRRLFDTFRREALVTFRIKGVDHATTVAQLKWAQWLKRDNILAFVRDHLDEVVADMKVVADSRKAERVATGTRKRRAHLTSASQGGRTVICSNRADDYDDEDQEPDKDDGIVTL